MNLARLDTEIVARGMESTRNRAQELINGGQVLVNGVPAKKPSMDVKESDRIEISGSGLKYVGRGGYKLQRALEEFGVKIEGVSCIDIGASTGGFTDCMLQNGARHVYAVDVGTSQLASELRSDPRVTVLEQTDARALTAEHIPEKCGLATFDVSFISLTQVVYGVLDFLDENGSVIALVKPQFEAGRKSLNKNGVVTSPRAHKEVLNKIYDYFLSVNLCVKAVCRSPIKGGKGNTEYLIHGVKGADNPIPKSETEKIV